MKIVRGLVGLLIRPNLRLRSVRQYDEVLHQLSTFENRHSACVPLRCAMLIPSQLPINIFLHLSNLIRIHSLSLHPASRDYFYKVHDPWHAFPTKSLGMLPTCPGYAYSSALVTYYPMGTTSNALFYVAAPATPGSAWMFRIAFLLRFNNLSLSPTSCNFEKKLFVQQ